MSTNIGMGACCLSGIVQSGQPKGSEINVGGLPTYLAEPESKSKAKTVVILSDIFGWKLPNVRLLADQYARAGFYTLIPDLHQGDSLPIEFLDDVEPDLKTREQLSVVDKAAKTAKVGATLPPWLVKHREGVVQPLVDEYLAALRKTPEVGKIGAVGFCWGGRYAVLAAHGAVDAAFAAHPSLLSIPSDYKEVKKPLGLAFGDADNLVPVSVIDKTRDYFAQEKKDVPFELRVYEKQVHGFALRGDFSSDQDKKAMDEVEKQAVAWLNKHLA